MSAILHLAIPAGSLEKTLPFYTDVLGCDLGNREEGRWVDVNFWAMSLRYMRAKNVCQMSGMMSTWELCWFLILAFT